MRVQPRNASMMSQAPVSTQLEVVVLFEDERAHQRMWSVYQQLLRNFSPGLTFNSIWCGLNELGRAHVARAITAAAINADLVLLSVQARPALASALTEWLEHWVSVRDPKTAALAVLFDPREAAGQPAPVLLGCLRDLAAKADLDFVFHFSAPKLAGAGPAPAPEWAEPPAPEAARFLRMARNQLSKEAAV